MSLEPKFNPRRSALHYAAQARVEKAEVGYDISDLTNSIAAGLIYVGDQLYRANLLAEFALLKPAHRDMARADEIAAELWPET